MFWLTANKNDKSVSPGPDPVRTIIITDTEQGEGTLPPSLPLSLSQVAPLPNPVS